MSEEHGPPYIQMEAKRPADKLPVDFDWHDFLANEWESGVRYEVGERVRPIRDLATGFEYEVTTAGTSGNRRPIFPATLDATVLSGSVTFTARALTNASLRTTISTSTFPTVTGVTLSDEMGPDDLVYTIYVAGGTNGCSYEIKQQVTLSNAAGEIKEAVALLPVLD